MDDQKILNFDAGKVLNKIVEFVKKYLQTLGYKYY